MQNIFIHPELSFKIIGIAFEVFKQVGPNRPEKIYQKAMAVELRDKGLNFAEQVHCPLNYKSSRIGRYYFDFLIEEKIVVEIKRGSSFSQAHFNQVREYLRTSNLQLGLLLNFAPKGVEVRRVVNLY